MKYDTQLTELKNSLPNAKSILIALPVGADIDKFAAGLALFLALRAAGKDVSIVSEDTIRVAQAHLFGVDNIKNTIPQGVGAGDFVITLEGVAVADPAGGRVPSLEKMDYFVEGANLNLVCKVLPGQTFQPTNVTYGSKQGGKADTIFVIGAANLNSLGNLYNQNQQIFTGVALVNIDNQANSSFGTTNVIDPAASSVSEILADVIPSLVLPVDQDTASNLLTGIYDVTANLSNEKVNPDTFLAVANLMKTGGQKPASSKAAAGGPGQAPGVSQPQVVPPAPVQSAPIPVEGVQTQTQPTPAQFGIPADSGAAQQQTPTLDLSMFMPASKSSVESVPNQPSPEERPSGESLSSAETIEPEPGWLTPKVFKGTSVG